MTRQTSDPTPAVPAPLAAWLADALGDPGPFTLEPLTGGNSNETLLLRGRDGRWVMRRPPAAAIAPSAHNMEREHRILVALDGVDVPAPAPGVVCADPDVPGAPFLVMEAVDGHAITDEVPDDYPDEPGTVAAIGHAAIDALAALHRVPWRERGLDGFGRHEGFLERQVPRWSGQLERYRHRDLPYFDEIGAWLDAHRPPDGEPGILHGDFHLDNVLLTPGPRIAPAAIIDWEMATIGDPLLDLGLFLAFWGADRPDPPAMPHVQGVSRSPHAPSRAALAERYAERSGRSVEHVDWYMTLAFWKLAAIVEGAHAQYVTGELTTPYAARLEHDVPRLLREAAGFAGIA
ncbi:MAG: phosphotransferase family protein [Solirubrobacteraceae bacterium]|nr:phosphotransferase family protein [Solirubrobacteraceae bacterium]